MKKILAGIAVLAVAAVAQADILATWTITGGAQSDVDNKISDIQFGQLTANGLNSTFSGAQWRLNNWANTTLASSLTQPAGQLDATFTLADNKEFTLESITSTLNGGGNPAPVKFMWYNGDTPVTGVNNGEFTASRTPAAVTWTGNGAGVWTESGTISLKATGEAKGGATSAAGTSWTSLQTTDLYGTVKDVTPGPGPTPAVPEPATMSLLGLGALAMALRRKLRK